MAAGRLLAAVRRAARFSQRVLAEQAGVSERTVRRIEAGKSASTESYWAIAHVLGLPPDWFVFPHRPDADDAEHLVIDAIDQLSRTGALGPNAIELVRGLAAIGLTHGQSPTEGVASGMLIQLNTARRRLEAQASPTDARGLNPRA